MYKRQYDTEWIRYNDAGFRGSIAFEEAISKLVRVRADASNMVIQKPPLTVAGRNNCREAVRSSHVR